ncbi:MAG: hypothetical protein NTV08_00455 [Verrucomicrobia bacterium]|nr:hypothetical protein [Verrucomicrobiota bacterium]
MALHGGPVFAFLRLAKEYFQPGFVIPAAAQELLVARPDPDGGEDDRGTERDDDQLQIRWQAQQPAEENVHHRNDPVVEPFEHVRCFRAS